MASVKESSKENFENQTDEEDIRGDGKKKKFKPLSAVRKFFGKKRKKEEVVVTMKAQSTTALESSGYDDDEDDGGFKSHQRTSVPLVGTRSISEDSIFSPEPRDQQPSFPKIAVSEDSIPKSSFQNELFSKLNKRRSQYSDDDQDEGIPRSPVPVVTTADVVAEPLKPLRFGKKPTGSTRDSEQSLISVDGSDMEDDLFTAKWKTSVPAKKSSEKPRMSSGSDLENMDFSSIEKTEILASSAAKDRISIKPQSRRASRLSRKKKESSLSKSLPCLNEESPNKPTVDSLAKSTNSKNTFSDDAKTSSSSQPERKKSLPNFSPTTDQSLETTLSKMSVSTSSASPTKSSSLSSNTAKVSESPDASKTVVTSPSKRPDSRPISPKDKEKKVAFSESQTKREMVPATVGQSGQSPSLKVSDPDSSVTLSPREGYRQKRQNRSKTLPSGIADEECSPKIQRANSHRTPGTTSPPSSSSQSNNSEESAKSTPASSSSVKKLGASRFSNFAPTSSNSEPSWVSKAKQKKLEQQGSSEDKEQTKPSLDNGVKKESSESVATTKSSDTVTPQAKSVLSSSSSSSSSQDKKRFSATGSFSNKGRESFDSTDKDKKVEVASSSLNAKRPSIDISSTKRESIDIDVRELSSIKDRTASFKQVKKVESANTTTSTSTSSSAKAAVGLGSSQDDAKSKVTSSSPTSPSPTSSTSLSTAQRAKLFSGGSLSNSSSTVNTAKPSSVAGGPIHSRAASVKVSPTKSAESNSSFVARPGSVKGTSFSSVGNSPTSNIKPDPSPSTTKEGSSSSSESSAVTKASSNPASNSTHNVSSTTTSSHLSSPTSSQPSLKSLTQAFSSPSASNFTKNNFTSGKSLSSSSSSTTASVAKPPISSSASASSSSNSNQKTSFSSSSVSSSSSSKSPSSSSSSSSSSKTPPKTQISPIRSHASFTSTSPFRPPVSSNTPSSSPRSSALTKSTSMKVSSPIVKKNEEKKTETTTTATTSPNIPAWRANLQKKDNMKIEIIEKKPPSSSSSSSSSSSPPFSQSKNENVKMFGDTPRVTEMAKKTDSSPTIQKTATASNRSSKVLDMVKNFQNLQVST